MRNIIEVKGRTLYKYEELDDRAKEKALEKFYDINVDYGWWDSVYEDASQIGIKITSFDLDRSQEMDGKFTGSAEETLEKILENHGEMCETFKTAKRYQPTLEEMKKQAEKDGEEYLSGGDYENWAHEFLYDILEDYRIILQHEYDYLTSKESIIETICANGYEFLRDGSLA